MFEPLQPSLINEIRTNLSRLARFGANISDAHSCFILIPSEILSPIGAVTPGAMVEIVGAHSLSNDIRRSARIAADSGLIGWVARHGRSIHVSPFEHDSRTLGVYETDQSLKSFIGIPVNLPFLNGLGADANRSLSGVIACDSKKSFAFSKLQGKLLEDLGQEISSTLTLILRSSGHEPSRSLDWKSFHDSAETLAARTGLHALDVVRLRLSNVDIVEAVLGASRTIELLGQVSRLILQALPEHVPACKLPNGDLLFALDSMMSAFYENKIRALCSHVAHDNISLTPTFHRQSARRNRALTSINDLVKATVPNPEGSAISGAQQGSRYEYSRA